jgi:hypothetical protein
LSSLPGGTYEAESQKLKAENGTGFPLSAVRFSKTDAMKLIAYPLAALLGLLGIVFVVGAQGQWLRIVVGVVLLAAAGALVWLALQRPKQTTTTVVQKIDLSGDVNLQELTCRSCGGSLGKDSVTVKAGAVFVNCPYCGAAYQLEEEPQW